MQLSPLAFLIKIQLVEFSVFFGFLCVRKAGGCEELSQGQTLCTERNLWHKRVNYLIINLRSDVRRKVSESEI